MPTRTTLKDRIVVLIKNGSSGPAADRVYVGRKNVLPSAATSFPVAYVYMLREDVDTLDMGASARSQRRAMVVAVDFWAKAATSALLESAFDTACSTLEGLINADTDLSVSQADIVLTSTEYLYEGDEDQPFGRAAMQFRVSYLSTE
jgi:hypothetical protein